MGFLGKITGMFGKKKTDAQPGPASAVVNGVNNAVDQVQSAVPGTVGDQVVDNLQEQVSNVAQQVNNVAEQVNNVAEQVNQAAPTTPPAPNDPTQPLPPQNPNGPTPQV